MSKRSKNNSIIFLTTLSVYLGLVLVGAPPILTHAALTRNFDIQNEIEVKEDSDNKPEKEEIENLSKDDFPTLFAQFLNELREEVKGGKIAFPIQTDFNVIESSEKSEFGGGGGGASSVSSRDLDNFIQGAINQKFLSKAFELADAHEKSKSVRIKIEANSTDFSLKVSFSKSNAEQFAEFLNREFSSSATKVKDALTKQIYENTSVTSENNQVFIVIRLPRGSLDALLTDSTK